MVLPTCIEMRFVAMKHTWERSYHSITMATLPALQHSRLNPQGTHGNDGADQRAACVVWSHERELQCQHSLHSSDERGTQAFKVWRGAVGWHSQRQRQDANRVSNRASRKAQGGDATRTASVASCIGMPAVRGLYDDRGTGDLGGKHESLRKRAPQLGVCAWGRRFYTIFAAAWLQPEPQNQLIVEPSVDDVEIVDTDTTDAFAAYFADSGKDRRTDPEFNEELGLAVEPLRHGVTMASLWAVV
eukprot:m.252814 g.252814  ORF g.252814 m.252814 type:complete len:244 (+) comp19128_c1_seq32:586-1317(+)